MDREPQIRITILANTLLQPTKNLEQKDKPTHILEAGKLRK